MKVVLYAREDELDEIRAVLSVAAGMHNEELELIPFSEWEQAVDWQDSEEGAAGPKSSGAGSPVCVISYPFEGIDVWHLKDSFRHFYLYVWGVLVDPDHCEWICRKRDTFADKGDLRRAKIYNKLLAEISFISKRTHVMNYPVQIQVESTERCNAQCVMCEHLYNHNAVRRDFSKEGIALLEKVFPFAEEVYIHGIGEPFIAENILPLLRSCTHFQIRVSSNSNMSYFTEEIIKEMKKCFFRLMISCDGATEETYEGIRRGTRLQDMLSNVRRIRAENPSIGLRMSVVAMRQNVRELPDIVVLAHSIGVEGITISHLVANPLIGNESDCLVHYPAHLHKYMRKARAAAESLGITIILPELDPSYVVTDSALAEEYAMMCRYPLFPSKEKTAEISKKYRRLAGRTGLHGARLEEINYSGNPDTCRGICDYLLEKPFIDSEGNVAPCCINPMYRLGNIYEAGGFMAVWNGELYRELRSEFYAGRLPGFCRNCQFLQNRTLKKIFWYEKQPGLYEKAYLGAEYTEILENIYSSLHS